jgi:thioredoxin reductase
MTYDAVIVGGGPAGLSAALALGRGRKRVLLCDAGARRNAAAEEVHNFVTRDGTPPNEFRRIAREQLAAYPSVEVRDARVTSITGSKGAFHVEVGGDVVAARRIVLCTGLIDELLPLEGFEALWGHAVFQCPYCHGWEVQDRAWGYLARAANAPQLLHFAPLLRGWSRDVTVFVTEVFDIPDETRAQLEAAGVRLETSPVARLVADGQRLQAVELANGSRVPCEVLFAHPPQRQLELVRALGVELDDEGLVRVDPMKKETSVPGVYAAGDLTTRLQAAVAAAAAGMQAAAVVNAELTGELAARGEI